MPTTNARPSPTVTGGLPGIGHALAFGRGPDRFIRDQRTRFGATFRVLLPDGARTFLVDPFDYPAFFRSRQLDFEAVAARIGSRAFGYDSTISGLHELGHDFGEALKGEPLDSLSAGMQVRFVRRLEADLGRRWHRTGLYDLLSKQFFAAGLEAIFGDGVYAESIWDAHARVDRYFPWLVLGIPARALPGLLKARRALMRAVEPLRAGRAPFIDERRRLFAQHQISEADGQMLDTSVIWASQANTVATAFWLLHHVLADPDARARLLAEARRCVPSLGGDEPQAFSNEVFRQMRLLDSAAMESMRLTSAPILIREATEDHRIDLDGGGSLHVRRGEQVCLYPRLTHLDPEIFPAPDQFVVDRFVGDASGPRQFHRKGWRVQFPLLPFGGGRSMCPGRFFARNELKVLVATLLTRFEIERVGRGDAPKLDMSRVGFGNLPPRGDLDIRIRRAG